MPETDHPVSETSDLLAAGGTDQGLLRSLARREPLIVGPGTSLRETLYHFSQDHLDAAVVCDPASGLPLGLIRLRDMLHVIGFEGGGLDDPVAVHMIGAPLTLTADAPRIAPGS
jgi:CBS domain-containing protein